MKGTNTLKLNESTMVEALDYWLQSNFTAGAIHVVSVKQTETQPCYVFEVEFESEVVKG